MTTLDDLTWPRRTERLTLTRATAEDTEAAWSYRRLPEVGQWTMGTPADREAFEERWQSPESLRSTLMVLRGATVIGDLMLEIEDAWGQRVVADRTKRTQARLGWTFAPEHQGQGYATEAVADLLTIAFDELGLRRVVAEAFAANEPSWRLMERLGLRRETLARADSLHAELGWIDGVAYALLADEWRSAGSPPRS